MPRCSLALDVLTRPPDLQDPVMTQPDTLMMIARKTYMGVNVPIYHFKQPDRLNPKQASPHADSARRQRTRRGRQESRRDVHARVRYSAPCAQSVKVS